PTLTRAAQRYWCRPRSVARSRQEFPTARRPAARAPPQAPSDAPAAQCAPPSPCRATSKHSKQRNCGVVAGLAPTGNRPSFCPPLRHIPSRRLDRSAKRGAERPFLNDKRPIVEGRSLHAARSLPRGIRGGLGRDDGEFTIPWS